VHAGVRRLYADLLAARRRWPALCDFVHRSARLVAPGALRLVRGGREPGAETAEVFFNLTPEPRPVPAGIPAGHALLFSSELARYHGRRASAVAVKELLPFECVAFGPAAWPAFV
jgi:hypothetical protein